MSAHRPQFGLVLANRGVVLGTTSAPTCRHSSIAGMAALSGGFIYGGTALPAPLKTPGELLSVRRAHLGGRHIRTGEVTSRTRH